MNYKKNKNNFIMSYKVPSLSNLCIVAISNQSIQSTLSSTIKQTHIDAECKYIRDFYAKLKAKKERYFFRLCLYYLGHRTVRIVHRNGFELLPYEFVDLEQLEHWQRAMWAACELCFGVFHTPEACVARIRIELPYSHQHGRYLNFPIQKFENSLTLNCPNMKGNVHAWYKVLLNVPPQMLLYEDFFG